MRIRNRIISVLFAFFLAVAGVVPLYAIDAYVTVIYRRIDVAFVNRSDSELNVVLSENNRDRSYYLMENYTMKKIRRLIIDSDYEFAMKADLVVIDNNLDNIEAVELYSMIAASLEKQQEQERAVAEQRKLELAKFQAEKDKQKVALEKDYKSVQTPTGDTVYVKSKEEKYTSTWWKLAFGIFDGHLINDVGNSFSSFRYGISADMNYEYTFDKIMVGIDLEGQAVILPFSGNDGTTIGDFSAVPKFALAGLSKKVQLRTGFAGVIRSNGKEPSVSYVDQLIQDQTGIPAKKTGGSNLQDNFFSPLVGIGLGHIDIGSLTISANADWLFGSFAYSDVNFAMKSALNMALPIAESEKFKVSFNLGAKDTLFARDTGLENRLGLIIGIGAENVIK